jgi:hypothetical protein
MVRLAAIVLALLLPASAGAQMCWHDAQGNPVCNDPRALTHTQVVDCPSGYSPSEDGNVCVRPGVSARMTCASGYVPLGTNCVDPQTKAFLERVIADYPTRDNGGSTVRDDSPITLDGALKLCARHRTWVRSNNPTSTNPEAAIDFEPGFKPMCDKVVDMADQPPDTSGDLNALKAFVDALPKETK